MYICIYIICSAVGLYLEPYRINNDQISHTTIYSICIVYVYVCVFVFEFIVYL